MQTPIDRTTQNYGLAGGRLDATRHIEAQIPGADGYIDANAYNHDLQEFLSKELNHNGRRHADTN